MFKQWQYDQKVEPMKSSGDLGTATGSSASSTQINFKIVRSFACLAVATFWSTFTPQTASTLTVLPPVAPEKIERKVQVHPSRIPSVFWNTSTSPETSTQDKWGQPQSQPYPKKKVLSAAVDASDGQSVLGNGDPERVSADRFVQPQSQPYPLKKSITAANQQAFFWINFVESPAPDVSLAGVAPVTNYFKIAKTFAARSQVLSWNTFTPANPAVAPTIGYVTYPDVVYKKKALLAAQQQATFLNVSTSPENVTLDRWQQPQSQPFPAKRLLHPSRLHSYVTDCNAIPLIPVPSSASWNPVYPDIARKKLYLTEAVDASDGQATMGAPPAPETVSADRFAQPQTQPYPYRKSLLTACQQAFAWFNFTPDPAPPPTASVVGSGPTPIAFKVNRSYPNRTPYFFWNTSTAKENVTADRWMQPVSQPVRPRPNVARFVFYTSSGVPVFPSPNPQPGASAVSGTNFFKIRRSFVNATPYLFYGNFTQFPGPAFLMDWQVPTEQPVRVKKSLHASNQQAAFWANFPNPSPPPVFDASQAPHDPTPQPVYKKQLSTAIQRSFELVEQTGRISTPYDEGVYNLGQYDFQDSWAETVTEDRWHQPQSQPWPGKRVLATAYQQALSWNTSFAPEAVSADRFVQPTEQPVRVKRSLHAASQPYFFWNSSVQPEAVFEGSWHELISQPVQTKKSLHASNQKDVFWNTSPQPEETSSDRWMQPISQPYPYTRALSAANQQPLFYTTFVPPNVNVFGWDSNNPQPTLRAGGLSASNQQAIAWNTSIDPETVSADKFVQPISQPVRPVFRAAVYLPQSYTPITTEASLEWFVASSQPSFRTKKTSAASQPSGVWSPFTPPEILILGWTPVFPQPYPYRRVLRPDLQQTLAWNTSTQPENVTVASWFQNTNEPYPYLRTLPAALQMASVWNTDTPPNIIPPYIKGRGNLVITVVGKGSTKVIYKGKGTVR